MPRIKTLAIILAPLLGLMVMFMLDYISRDIFFFNVLICPFTLLPASITLDTNVFASFKILVAIASSIFESTHITRFFETTVVFIFLNQFRLGLVELFLCFSHHHRT